MTVTATEVLAVDSAKVVTEIRTKVLQFKNISQSGSRSLTTGIVDSFVQDAVMEVYKDIGVIKSKAIAVTNGSQAYLVDEGLMNIISAVMDTSGAGGRSMKPLKPILKKNLREATYTDDQEDINIRPYYYTRNEDTIKLWPPLHTYNSGTDTLKIEFRARGEYPDATNEVPGTVWEHQLAIVFKTCVFATMRQGQWDVVAHWEKYYRAQVDIILGRETNERREASTP